MEQAALLAQYPATSDAQPPPAANPSPAAGAPTPSHPSYIEMITEAIQWGSSQGKEGGSSKRAIAKYIDRVYTNLPPSHSALLTHHLKRLKSSGHLVMVKNSYQLASAVPQPPPRSADDAAAAAVASAAVSASPAPVDPSPKRRPGRPPKPKPDVPASTAPVHDNGSGSGFGFVGETGKKKRGRPPKQQSQGAVAAEVPFVQPISEVQPQPNVVMNGVTASPVSGGQKRRGRPPKVQQPPVVPFAQPVSQAPAVQMHEDAVAAAATADAMPKRRPGRPPKTASVNVGGTEGSVGGAPPARGRPKKNAALGPVSRPVGKRPRGRPKKLGGGAMAVGMAPGKRRGRPPKGVGGPPKMVKRRSGRPVGRPRKYASTLGNHSSHQDGMANEELTKKFELIQSKIREAVTIIRPCVANEDAALTALQQLEELASGNRIDPPKTDPEAVTSAPGTTMPQTVPQSMGPVPTQAVPLNYVAPPPTVPGPFMGGPAAPTYTVSAPEMSVNAPLHAPPGMESQHPMSWISSNEGQ